MYGLSQRDVIDRRCTHSLIVPEKLSNKKSAMCVLFMDVEFGFGPIYK